MTLTPPKERLHPKAIWAWRIKGAVYFLIYSVLVAAFFITRIFVSLPLQIGFTLLGIALFLGVIQILIIPKLRMIYWGYEIKDNEIDIQHGIIVVKRTLIPMARIQHVDTEHGPIMRQFKLATLNIATAGTEHKIPALDFETARMLRKKISSLAALSDDDV
ncbi:MAG: PH domain-containing protein [Bacillota bacterium]